MTEPGANEQVKSFGSPEHVSSTLPLNVPDCGATVTVTCPCPPEEIFNELGLAVSDKVGLPPETAGQFRLNFTAPDILFVMLGLPTA